MSRPLPQIMKDYRITFSSPHGRRVLNDLLNNHWTFDSIYRSDGDTVAMYIREGERIVVNRIMTMLKIRPEHLPGVKADLMDEFEFEGSKEDG